MNQLMKRHEEAAEKDVMILARIPGVFDSAGDHEKAHRLRTRFCEASNNSLLAVVDHAFGLIRHLRRADEAEASLGRIGDQEQNSIVKVFVIYTKALIALERNQFAVALSLLEETENASLPIKNPGMNGMRNDIRAFQAICLSCLGRSPEARQLSRDSLSLLKARKAAPSSDGSKKL